MLDTYVLEDWVNFKSPFLRREEIREKEKKNLDEIFIEITTIHKLVSNQIHSDLKIDRDIFDKLIEEYMNDTPFKNGNGISLNGIYHKRVFFERLIFIPSVSGIKVNTFNINRKTMNKLFESSEKVFHDIVDRMYKIAIRIDNFNSRFVIDRAIDGSTLDCMKLF